MYEPYNPYNPYYNYNLQSQQLSQPFNKQNQSMYKPQNMIALQGKVVDSLDVVKATDIPYDGSVSYFPLTDHSAIITKQLQQDGTSKMIIYKPISADNDDNKPKYITENELEEYLKNMNGVYVTESEVKEKLKNINNKDIKDLKEDVKSLKRTLEDVTDELRYKKEK